MDQQRLKVTGLPWQDVASGQKTVEFTTPDGTTFTCLVDGGDVKLGETVTVVDFDYLEVEGDVFSLNPAHERTITQLDEWDVEIKGRIVGLSDDTGLVDCGGVVIPLYRFTADTRAVGAWVGAVLRRLEAEVE